MKKLRIHVFVSLLLIVISLGIGYCTAESFLVQRSKNKGPSVNQIKQDIMSVLADLLQQESKSIELKACIQQSICKCITQLAENNKDSEFSKANRSELQLTLDKLQNIKEINERHLQHVNKTLLFIQNGCVEHIPKIQS